MSDASWRGGTMKNKHMTKEMRERIELGIRNNESLKDISAAINKDPTTISKEVLKHRKSYAVDRVSTSFHFAITVRTNQIVTLLDYAIANVLQGNVGFVLKEM